MIIINILFWYSTTLKTLSHRNLRCSVTHSTTRGQQRSRKKQTPYQTHILIETIYFHYEVNASALIFIETAGCFSVLGSYRSGFVFCHNLGRL